MKAIISLLFSFLTIYTFGQEISFKELNSSNVLNLFDSPSLNIENKLSTNTQIGIDNKILVYDNKGKNLEIVQRGDYNTTNYVNAGNKSTDLQINSVGNNNYIDVTGNNSNSEGMKINIKGNDKMIFVRNY